MCRRSGNTKRFGIPDGSQPEPFAMRIAGPNALLRDKSPLRSRRRNVCFFDLAVRRLPTYGRVSIRNSQLIETWIEG
jgi:hypothetical protein